MSCPEVVKVYILPGDQLLGDSSSRVSGAVVNLSCNDGYKLNGPDRITCTAGSWVPSVPSCVEDETSEGLSEKMIVIIACIVVGVIVFVVLSALLWLYIMRRRKRQQKTYHYHDSQHIHHSIQPVMQPADVPPPPVIPTVTEKVYPNHTQYDDHPFRPWPSARSDDYPLYRATAAYEDTRRPKSDFDMRYAPEDEDDTFLKTASSLLLSLTDIWKRRQRNRAAEESRNYYTEERRFSRPLRADTAAIHGVSSIDRRPYGVARVHDYGDYPSRAITVPMDRLDRREDEDDWYDRERYQHDRF